MSVHPKIQVESRANIEFLIQECVNFAYNHTNKSNEKQASLQHITRVVQRLFLSAGNCIEINKVPFHEAFQTKKEYEPIDEQLVEETRAAQHRVQQKLLELTTLRKRVPQMIRTTRDTIDLDEEMDIHEDVITLALSNSNYIKTCAIKQDLKKVFFINRTLWV